ncbi:hypothetical protein ACFVSQ_09195 [Streptomyces niveus]|uniref:hypothetical protein n=1 Tax=Streptomyces niveus TaxID=193462 RepID=UPI0036E6C470
MIEMEELNTSRSNAFRSAIRLGAHVSYNHYVTHRMKCELCKTPGIQCGAADDLHSHWREARKAMLAD